MRTTTLWTALLLLVFIAVSEISFGQKFLYTVTTETGIPDDVFDSVGSGPRLHVKFDNNVLSSPDNSNLSIYLPDFASTQGKNVVIRKYKQDSTAGGFAWFGRIVNQPSSFVLITQVKDVFTGQIRTADNKFYCIEYKGKNIHRVSKINQDLIRPDMVMKADISVYDPTRVEALKKTADLCCDSNVIDVLVLYTPGAKRGARGVLGMASLILQCRYLTNETFANSNIPGTIEIVHEQEIKYTESGNINDDLTALKSSTTLSRAATSLRDQYAADIVILIVENSGSESNTGMATVMDEVSPAFESQAFCVMRRDAAIRDLVFPHEIGHILGARHHCGMDWTPTPFAYSHGYYNDHFSTIMAKTLGVLRIEYWSDPDILYPGTNEPTGTSVPTGQTNCQAMDAVCLRQTFEVVSKFRCKTKCVIQNTRGLIFVVIDTAKKIDTTHHTGDDSRKDDVHKKSTLMWWILAAVAALGFFFFLFGRKKKNKRDS